MIISIISIITTINYQLRIPMLHTFQQAPHNNTYILVHSGGPATQEDMQQPTLSCVLGEQRLPAPLGGCASANVFSCWLCE